MEDGWKPVLSISVLVSNNRRDTIEKCMESLVPLRKTIPSELVIVDTGCMDGSVDIARQYADKVISFTWCNDFSAARNAGLFECTGEWFLFLDDDEWFEEVSELISFFQGEERNRYDALQYLTRNYHDFEGKTYTDAYVGRAVKRTPETRFCGKIHEWIEPVAKRIKTVNDYVHHYGYVFRNEEEKQKHAQRNLVLLEEMVKENPEDVRMCCQLAQVYRRVKRYEDVVRLCKETLSTTTIPRSNAFVQYLFLAIPRAYREWGKYEKALEEFERLEQNEQLLRPAKLVLFHEKAAALVCLRRETELQKTCKLYLKEYEESLKQPIIPEHMTMDFASFSSPFVRQVVAEYGVMSVLRSKDMTYAADFFEAVEWSEDRYELAIALIQCYVDSEDGAFLRKFLPRVLEVDGLKGMVYGTLDSMYQQNPEKRKRISEDVELLALAEQLKTMVRAQLAEGKIEEAKAILSELATMLPEDEEVKEMLRNLKDTK